LTEITYDPGIFSRQSDERCSGVREKHVSWHRRRDIEDITLLKEALSTYLRQHTTIADVCLAETETSLAERFREQAEKWQQETQHLSSPGQRMMHPSYQAIMGMASDNPREVISLMIRDLQQNRRAWFWALSYLAQDNPISASDAGRTDKMIKSWVKWGEAKGLL